MSKCNFRESCISRVNVKYFHQSLCQPEAERRGWSAHLTFRQTRPGKNTSLKHVKQGKLVSLYLNSGHNNLLQNEHSLVSFCVCLRLYSVLLLYNCVFIPHVISSPLCEKYGIDFKPQIYNLHRLAAHISGLKPSTLPLGHGDSPQYWTSPSHAGGEYERVWGRTCSSRSRRLPTILNLSFTC